MRWFAARNSGERFARALEINLDDRANILRLWNSCNIIVSDGCENGKID
jgi:hypothetical protein